MSNAEPANDSPRGDSMMRKTPTHHMSGRVAGLSRFIVVAPVIGLFVAAVALTALASIDVVRTIFEVLQRDSSLKQTLVAFIEVADIYLLSIVLYIISLGLYELFIDENVALPPWLQIHTLEDLKEKLVSVVVVVLAVFFLGKVIEAKNSLNVLYLGAGIAVMIAALGYFVSRVLLHHDE